MNTKMISLSQVRSDLMRIYAAAISAVMPERLIDTTLDGTDPKSTEARSQISAATAIRLLAIGKAALGMAQAMRNRLGGKISNSLVIAPQTRNAVISTELCVLQGSHPSPDTASEKAGRAALEFTAQTKADELLLLLLSGGASSLMAVPAPGINIAEKANVTDALMRCGAPIGELNTVRKHLSQIKGGLLLRALPSNAQLLSLILSDVPGNDLATIGSGPTVADPTTFADTIAVLKRRKLWGRVPERVRDHLERGAADEIAETVKPGDPIAFRATNLIIGDNSTAQAAAIETAESLGYAVEQIGDLSRDAEQVGRDLIDRLCRVHGKRICLIGGGESVVAIKGNGKGGRAQHCALAAAIELNYRGDERRVAGLFAGTDGVDGPTEAAGAIISTMTVQRALEAGIEPQAVLNRNDSYSLFKALGDLIVIGPTGTNVSDIFVGIVNY